MSLTSPNGQDLVITGITKGNPGADLVGLGEGLVDLEVDGNRPQEPVLEPHVLHHAVEVVLVQETLKWGEGPRENHFQITQMPVVQSERGQRLGLLEQLVMLWARKKKEEEERRIRKEKEQPQPQIPIQLLHSIST